MPAPSRETLERMGAATGYQPGTLEKVLRLLDLLQEIAEDNLLATRLALKGGKWLAVHPSALGGQGVLEVDVNFMMRQPLFGVAAMDSVILEDWRARSVCLIDRHELVAGKLVALLDRRAGRDLFDARRLFAWDGLNWKWIRAAMLAIGASGRNDWREASVETIDVDGRELRRKLIMCLPRTAFEDEAAIDAWIAETIALCRDAVRSLLAYSRNERAFLDGVIDRGEIDAGLLDVEPEIQGRIAAMPMLKWKAIHAPGRNG